MIKRSSLSLCIVCLFLIACEDKTSTRSNQANAESDQSPVTECEKVLKETVTCYKQSWDVVPSLTCPQMLNADMLGGECVLEASVNERCKITDKTLYDNSLSKIKTIFEDTKIAVEKKCPGMTFLLATRSKLFAIECEKVLTEVINCHEQSFRVPSGSPCLQVRAKEYKTIFDSCLLKAYQSSTVINDEATFDFMCEDTAEWDTALVQIRTIFNNNICQ